MATYYEDDGHSEVEAQQRFLTDPVMQKMLFSLASAFGQAQHPEDENLDELEIPELTRNERVLVMTGIYAVLEEVIGHKFDPNAAHEGDEEARVETAKDKRMSVYYKAFMGKMRDLVGPWHANRDKFAAMWASMGNDLYTKSPAEESDSPVRLVVVKEDDLPNEEAAVIGGRKPLARLVSRSLAAQGFEPLEEADEGEAAWVKSGAAEGHPDKQVILIRREDDSYAVVLSAVNKHDAYGRVIQRKPLGAEASPQAILQTIAHLYDEMVVGS